MILAADVGGTKTVLALFDPGAAGLRERAREQYPSAAHASFEEILDRFLAAHERPTIEALGVAAAGPVVDGRVRLTNLAWSDLEVESLRRALGGARVALLNDLQAMAYGMLGLPEQSLVALNPEAGPPPAANIAVIAAGTGLGEAFLVWDGVRHLPIACEGGHGGFAPSSDEQDALLRFLRSEVGGRVSWERVLSGPGLASLYRFVRAESGEPEPPDLSARLAAEDPGSVVTQVGLAGQDAACAHALELFAALYGAEAGDLALRTLALGGVYLGGGIAPRILPVLERGDFLRAFLAKGRFEPLLRRVPVHVCLDPATPLLGAARWVAAG